MLFWSGAPSHSPNTTGTTIDPPLGTPACGSGWGAASTRTRRGSTGRRRRGGTRPSAGGAKGEAGGQAVFRAAHTSSHSAQQRAHSHALVQVLQTHCPAGVLGRPRKASSACSCLLPPHLSEVGAGCAAVAVAPGVAPLCLLALQLTQASGSIGETGYRTQTIVAHTSGRARLRRRGSGSGTAAAAAAPHRVCKGACRPVVGARPWALQQRKGL